MKLWQQEKCGCIKATLPRSGKVRIRCHAHKGKPAKKGRLLCYFDDNGQVRSDETEQQLSLEVSVGT
jgi:hypothetical protein